MLRRLTRRLLPWQVDVAAVLLMALLGATAYLVHIGPRHKKYHEHHARAAELLQQSSRQRELNADLARTRQSASDLRRFLVENNLPLESRQRLNERMTRIFNLATECDLAPDSIEPQRETAEAFFTTIGLRLGGRGTYGNCMRFLERLRKEMPDNAIVGFEITGSPAPGQPAIQFGVQLVWHAAPTAMAQN